MTNPQTLLDLADEVERSEPSRELDAKIARTIGPDRVWAQVPPYEHGLYHCANGAVKPCPAYTTSLDAAITLTSEENAEAILFEAMMRCGQAKASFKKDLDRFVTAASLRAMEAPNEQ